MKRPTQPLPNRPGGYLQLESYSSLQRLYMLLEGAEKVGRKVRLQRGDTEAVCRRVIEGFALERAGGLLDEKRPLEEGDITLHPALIALTVGDFAPLRSALTLEYSLSFTFALGFTRERTLILKPSAVYKAKTAPKARGLQEAPAVETFADLASEPLLPDSVKFYPRRFSGEEWRVLLERACGVRV